MGSSTVILMIVVITINSVNLLTNSCVVISEKEWNKMMKWLNSSAETAKNLKYLVHLLFNSL